jgi:integrase
MALSATKVHNAQPKTNKDGKTVQRKYYDRDGLYLLVKPHWAKLWHFKYHAAGGGEKTLSLGQYPVVGLAEAREGCLAARRQVKAGIDPMVERKAEAEAKLSEAKLPERKAANSFESVARRWHENWRADKKVKTIGTIMDRFADRVFQAIGRLYIEDVTAADIRALILETQNDGARDVAQRLQQTIGQVYRYAIAHGLASRNPATDFKPTDVLRPVKKQNRKSVDEKEFPALVARVWHYSGSQVTVFGMRMMLYTFLRTTEMREGFWTEIDYEEALWDIPAVRIKTVRGDSLPHLVPLSRQALAVLEGLREVGEGAQRMFPGAVNPTRPMSENTILYGLYALGYKNLMTGHGFRTLASTILNKNKRTINISTEAIEAQLSHVKRDKVAATYDKWNYIDERRELMQWWGDHVDAALKIGREQLGLPAESTVIPVRWRPRDKVLSIAKRGRAHRISG